MKRSVIAVGMVLMLAFVHANWIEIELPSTVTDLNNDIDKHALVYEVIDGTPLVVATFGSATFLDTLHLERFSMNMPPYPQWQWTGNWERIYDPGAIATADLSAAFGPTVLFGVINDDSIVGIEVVRDGIVIRSYEIDGPAYILSAQDVLLTDTVRFVDQRGNVVFSERPLD